MSTSRSRPTGLMNRVEAAPGRGSNPRGRFAALLSAQITMASLATAPLAQSPPGQYDGLYYGFSEVNPALSSAGCLDRIYHAVAIEGGKLTGVSRLAGTFVEALVAEDGFFTGSYFFADGTQSVFEGTIEGSTLRGGIIKEGPPCFWTLLMTKE